MKEKCPKCGGSLRKEARCCLHCGWGTAPPFLSSGERVVFSRMPSYWWTGAWTIRMTITLAAAAVISNLYPESPYISYLWPPASAEPVTFDDFIIWLPLYLYGFGSWWVRDTRYGNTLYAATDKRIVRTGYLDKKPFKEFPVSQIQEIRIRKLNFLGRVLGYGTLKFYTGPSGDGNSKSKMVMKWVGVPKPRFAKRMIEEVVGESRLAREKKAKVA